MNKWLPDFVKALYNYSLPELKMRIELLEKRLTFLKSSEELRYYYVLINSLVEELTAIREVVNDRERWDRIS